MPHYDLYDSLDIAKDASTSDIVQELHNRISASRFENYGGEEEVRLAYEILGTPQKRQLYDARLDETGIPDITVDDLRTLGSLQIPEPVNSGTSEYILSTTEAPVPPQQHPMTTEFLSRPSGGGAPVARQSWVIPALIIVALLVALAALAIYAFGWGPGRSTSSSLGSPTEEPEVVVVTSTMTAAPGATPGTVARPAGTPSTTSNRPTNVRLPANAAPANESAQRASEEGGRFNKLYVGSSVTSEPFARAVHTSFIAHYRETGQTEGVVRAYSPVTEKSYAVTCSDNGQYVTCNGGTNAVVYIY